MTAAAEPKPERDRFLRNHWYAVGFPEDFGRQFVARTLLNEAVVIFRKEDGTPVALEDRCAHRRLPLSMGRLKGDTVECAYHGLVYDCTGACVHIPGEERVPAGARVRSYPVLDRFGFLWIWMGDPAKADPKLLPEYQRISDPAYGKTRIALNPQGNYLLVMDNLLDLSHLPYVHGTTTGNPPVAEEAKVEIKVKGERVHVIRTAENVEPSRTFQEFGGYNGKVDLWAISEFRPPSYVRVSYGSAPTGRGIPTGEDIWGHGHWGFQVLHGLTPETGTTTHHHRYVVFQPGNSDQAVLEEFHRQCDQIINEDVAVFAVQQRALVNDHEGASAWQPNPRVTIKADGGLVAMRAITARLLTEKRAKPAARKAPAKKAPPAKRTRSAKPAKPKPARAARAGAKAGRAAARPKAKGAAARRASGRRGR